MRLSKREKPYFVCDSCGIQIFVRRKEGIERLNKFLDVSNQYSVPFQQATERVYEIQARLNEIDATKAQITKLEDQIGFFFQDENKIRACEALKTHLDKLLVDFEDFCK
jgi:DNA repair ATPase RecN